MPKRKTKISEPELATVKLRFVRRSPLGCSQREVMILQQWFWNSRRVRGEWRDVPVEKETYVIADGITR